MKLMNLINKKLFKTKYQNFNKGDIFPYWRIISYNNHQLFIMINLTKLESNKLVGIKPLSKLKCYLSQKKFVLRNKNMYWYSNNVFFGHIKKNSGIHTMTIVFNIDLAKHDLSDAYIETTINL